MPAMSNGTMPPVEEVIGATRVSVNPLLPGTHFALVIRATTGPSIVRGPRIASEAQVQAIFWESGASATRDVTRGDGPATVDVETPTAVCAW